MDDNRDPKPLERIRLERHERTIEDRLKRTSGGRFQVLVPKGIGDVVVKFHDPHLLVDRNKSLLGEICIHAWNLAVEDIRKNPLFYSAVMNRLAGRRINIQRELVAVFVDRYPGPDDYENLVVNLHEK